MGLDLTGSWRLLEKSRKIGPARRAATESGVARRLTQIDADRQKKGPVSACICVICGQKTLLLLSRLRLFRQDEQDEQDEEWIQKTESLLFILSILFILSKFLSGKREIPF